MHHVAGLAGFCANGLLYGEVAEKVHGGRQVDHCMKYTLYSLICLCGAVAGPTRKAIRDKYGLPAAPGCLATCGADGQFCNPDCATNSIPFLGEMAVIQDYMELASRDQTWTSEKIKPQEFDWGLSTAAPAQASMEK